MKNLNNLETKVVIFDEEDIIERYKRVHQSVKYGLAESYTGFLDLELIAYGDSKQRKLGLNLIKERMVEGKEAFRVPGEDYLRFLGRISKISINEFSDNDKLHLSGLRRLIKYANKELKRGKLNRKKSQKVYNYLNLFLYGKKVLRTIPKKPRSNPIKEEIFKYPPYYPPIGNPILFYVNLLGNNELKK